ncbi:MAG: PQQ-binding-like beta-propeller repeat protein [Thermomicrobiales bacterium]
MFTKASLSALTTSRRSTMRLALAMALAGKFGGLPMRAVAQDTAAGTWNWRGNAGNTGELPGPGLDLGSALGELWRLPATTFGDDPAYGGPRVNGYWNGVVFSMAGESVVARRLKDGTVLWEHTPAMLASAATPVAAVQAGTDRMSFYGPIAIDNDLLLMATTNGHVIALDARTGDARWDIVWKALFSSFPVIVDHVAYGTIGSGVAAIDLSGSPKMRWRTDVDAEVVGVESGYVYVVVGDQVRALTAEDGSEYWRITLGDDAPITDAFGVLNGSILLESFMGSRSSQGSGALAMVDANGEVGWTTMTGPSTDIRGGWAMNATLTTMQLSYGGGRLQALNVDNGKPLWELVVYTDRWDYVQAAPVVCAGRAYVLVRDMQQGRNLLAIVDPAMGEVVGAWDSNLVPFFLADGVMLAQDDDTNEIVAIGAVPAVVRSGGRATVTGNATLRGAPRDTAIERATLPSGTLVTVTGDGETTDGVLWVPVTVADTGDRGWMPADVLAGQDGGIRFESIRPTEFGQFTTYPRFTTGTRAEITETVDLQGAPSSTSARKATLDAGTRVTVASSPMKNNGEEWCSVTVDATGMTGWVPSAVLRLVPDP